MGMGFGAVNKAVEKSEASRGGGNYLSNIFWKDDRKGEGKDYKKVVRFLTDDVIVAKFYEFVPGGKPNKDGKQFPREFVAVDSVRDIRNPAEGDPEDGPYTGDLVFPELQDERDYFKVNNIILKNYKGIEKPATEMAVERTLGIAVLREVIQGSGKRSTDRVVDKKVTKTWKDKDGVEKEEEGFQYGLIRQANKNFWNSLAGYYAKYGTICDRDYEITRMGNGTDTSYVIIPLDKDEELWAEDIDDLMAKLEKRYTPPMSLNEWVTKYAKYETAERHMEWQKFVDGEDGGAGAATTTTTTSSAEDDDESEGERRVEAPVTASREDLKAKLLAYGK